MRQNKIHMEPWKQPMSHPKCNSVLKVINTFKEQISDIPRNQSQLEVVKKLKNQASKGFASKYLKKMPFSN